MVLGVGAAIAGGGKLVGGILNAFGASKAHKDNQNAQRRVEHDNDVATEQYNSMIDKVTTRVNKIAYAKAQAAAKVPIVTAGFSQDSGKDVTTTNYGRTTTTVGDVDTAAMMAAAERSGFNPVTWLQNGGMQAFMKTTTMDRGKDTTTTQYGRRTETGSVETGRYAFEAALQGNVMPALMSAPQHQAVMQQGNGPMGAIGDGIAGAASEIGSDFSQQRQNNFQMQLQQAALDGQLRNSRAVQGGRSFYGPHVKLTGPTTQNRGGGDFNFGGYQWDTDPNYTNASDYNERYGELGDLAGIGIADADYRRWLEQNDPMPDLDPYDPGRLGPWLGMPGGAVNIPTPDQLYRSIPRDHVGSYKRSLDYLKKQYPGAKWPN